MATKEQINIFNEKYAKEFDKTLSERYSNPNSLESLKENKEKLDKILSAWQEECNKTLN